MSTRQQGLAVSVRATARMFHDFRSAVADFSCFCVKIIRHTSVPLRGSLPSSQLSCSGIPLDTFFGRPKRGYLVGPNGGPNGQGLLELCSLFNLSVASPFFLRLDAFQGNLAAPTLSYMLASTRWRHHSKTPATRPQAMPQHELFKLRNWSRPGSLQAPNDTKVLSNSTETVARCRRLLYTRLSPQSAFPNTAIL